MAVSIEAREKVAAVTIDNPPVNATSQAVRAGLLDAVAKTDQMEGVTAVVLRAAGRTFVAGGDIREFDQPPIAPHLPDVIAAIEAAAKPWVAALHGTTLGGGLEIALGCHHRIAAAGTKLGLPEVALGLIPGAGGTVRLPRLVAPELALTLIAGGKPIGAEEAQDAGLIDAIVEGDLTEAAIALAAQSPKPVPTLSRPPRAPQDPEAFATQAAKLRAKARGQVSVDAAITALETALTSAAPTALTQARESFLDLKASSQSKALRHIFFAERATLSDPRCKATPRPFEQVGVVGGGTMGAGIAVACLLKGMPVTLAEQGDDAANAARDRVETTLDQTRARGLLSDAGHADAIARFSTATEFSAFQSADLVIEAVFEDLEVKREVFARLDAATRSEAILATNTSYLDVNAIAGAVADPSRVIGLHFFSPAHIMKLLEIVMPAEVADDVVASAAALSKRLGKIGVLAGVCDGFIGNRIMSAYRAEADVLIEDGAAPQEVDAAMRAYGFGMGVFEMQDLAGLDIAWAMRKRRAALRDPADRMVTIADRLCEAGRFGRKTGQGWYSYATGRAEPDLQVEALIAEERTRKGIVPRQIDGEEIMARLLAAMTSTGRAVLDEVIAQSAADIDVVMVNGFGFPRWRGGPMHAGAA